MDVGGDVVVLGRVLISGEKDGVGFVGIDIDVVGCEWCNVIVVGFYYYEFMFLYV